MRRAAVPALVPALGAWCVLQIEKPSYNASEPCSIKKM